MWELYYTYTTTQRRHISADIPIFTYAFYSNNKPVCLNTMNFRHFTNTNWWIDLKYKTLFWAEIWKINAHGNLCILLALRSRILYFKLIHTQLSALVNPTLKWKSSPGTLEKKVKIQIIIWLIQVQHCVFVTYLTDWLKYFIYGEVN